MSKNVKKNKSVPVCLSIAGLDPSGGAGILADVKTFFAFGCFGTAAVTSVTFQNTQSVFGAVHQTADDLTGQLNPVFEDFDVAAVKTGMLPTAEVIEAVAEVLTAHDTVYLVVDPVVRSTSGFDLIDDRALATLTKTLFKKAVIVTPNHVEAERICGFAIENDFDFERAAENMLNLGAKYVLIKGGHRPESHSAAKIAVDRLYGPDGMRRFEAEFIETSSTHGTGCTLSAAITAGLSFGQSIEEAVGNGKDYVTEAIKTSHKLGKGNSPLNHWAGVKSRGER